MGLQINTNLSALGTMRATREANKGLKTVLGKMNTGLRINQAADDAAGLAIAERFRTRVSQMAQENNNLQSGISAVQTAEGGLSVQQEAISRLRELAVQASNGTLSDENRQALNQEAQQLIEQINTVGSDTQFNGMGLLNGDAANVELGTEGGDTLNIEASNAGQLGIDTVDISTAQGATDAIAALDNAAAQVSQNRASLGAQQNGYQSAIAQRDISIENSTAAEAAIRDADIAQLVMERTRNEVLMGSGLAALAQSNVSAQNALSLLGG